MRHRLDKLVDTPIDEWSEEEREELAVAEYDPCYLPYSMRESECYLPPRHISTRITPMRKFRPHSEPLTP